MATFQIKVHRSYGDKEFVIVPNGRPSRAQVAARAALASRFTWERNATLTLSALRSIL